MKARKTNPTPETAGGGVRATEMRDGLSNPVRWGLAFAGLLLALLIYSPSMDGPFVFDDEYLPFRDPSFLQVGVRNISPMARPLMNYSFWVNQRLFGMEPFSYHFTNVLLHVFNACLMFFALRKLLEMGNVKNGREWLAAFAAGLFLLHPVNAESVAYVAGRSESFSLPLFLGAYCVFLYKRRGGIGWGAAAGTILLFGAAFLSKEHTAILPALLILTDICFPEGTAVQTIRRNWRLYVPMAVVGAIGVVLVAGVLRQAKTAGFQMKDLPWNHYFYTQWRALWVYLRLFVAPVGLNADWDYPISRSVFDHGAIFGLLGLVLLLAVAFRYRARFPLVFFGLLAFGLLMAPTSSVVPIKDALAERRLYLPFIGLLLVTCNLLQHWRASLTIRVGTLAGVLLLFASMTYNRSTVWGDPMLLWKNAAEQAPQNSRARFHLAMIYYERQECPEAVKKFEDAARVGKPDYTMLLDWGLAYDCANQFDQALDKFREAQKLENTAHVRSLAGMALAKQGKNGAALDELNEAARLDPGYDMTYLYRGNVYLSMKEFDAAGADYRRALALKPDSPDIRRAMDLLERRRNGAR